jgi:nitrogen-specific signal transduction histidine kinase/CheY-like chemotaxis protein
MKTVLVLTERADFPEAVREALSPGEYRIVHQRRLSGGDFGLPPQLVHVCLIEVAELGGLAALEKVRRQLPSCRTIVYTEAGADELENEAYRHGADRVVPKPVQATKLQAILQGLGAPPTRRATPPPRPSPNWEASSKRAATGPSDIPALDWLSRFSGILSGTLSVEALCQEVLRVLRDTTGFNRAVIFLRHPSTRSGGGLEAEPLILRPASAIGLSAGLPESFELSTGCGIGGVLFERGRMLWADSEWADETTATEFEVMGTEVAVPIIDRHGFLGVAAFGGQLAGDPLTDTQLKRIYSVLEQAGTAIRNVWVHEQLAADHGRMGDALRQLSHACLVVNMDLTIVHSNAAARKLFASSRRGTSELRFEDLPSPLASKIYQVLKTGTAIASFDFEPPARPGHSCQINLMPLRDTLSGQPSSVLLIGEDRTQLNQAHQMETESVTLAAVKMVAGALADQMGNALVPISVYQELVCQRPANLEALAGLDKALAQGVQRLSRLTELMRVLAQVERRVAVPATPIRLHEVVKAALASLSTPAATKQVQLQNQADPTLPPVPLDEPLFKDWLECFLKGILERLPARGSVSVSARQFDLTVEVEIHENGPELSEGMPWFVCSGLEFVKAYVLARLLGGNIQVKSLQGAGNTFTLRFPSRNNVT